MRAGLFALVGSVLAALGHHAGAEGAVPWRLVTAFALGQFALVRPVARHRLSPAAVTVCTLAAQGSLHLALTWAGGSHHPAGHSAAGHAAMADGDGHAWHQASVSMTAAHVAAALGAGWLLHRADAAVAAALTAARLLHGAAAAVVARVLPPVRTVTLAAAPSPQPDVCFALPRPAGASTMEHALVRRGPPGRIHVPHCPFTRATASARCPVPPARSSPCPRTAVPPPHAVSLSSVPPR
ncbi:hypothetical protein ABZ490_22850 [Streptomyces sp. NPDC005811]|uniref:hypothetical protein n=1 Tax=Streptomyces sp. NPDC005811 TaxID=3154565 RepID=UPI0034086D54